MGVYCIFDECDSVRRKHTVNPASTQFQSNPNLKLRWAPSWILAGAVGVAIVTAMQVPAPVTLYVFHLVQGVCCAAFLIVSVRKDSGFARLVTIVCWTLGWSISRDIWPDPMDASYTRLLLRISVTVIPVAAAAVCFPRYFMSRKDAGSPNAETSR
jgi:hypothetical protein